jgi:hypothetical protein
MRFTTSRDYQTMLKINKELINTIIDTPVVLYKMNQELTKTNSYGEATKKTWYIGVQVPCLINRDQANPNVDVQTVNFEQSSEFEFLRVELEARNVYPEIGDIIEFHDSYYEINNVNEIQLYAGRTEYNHSIVCQTHLTRNTNLQLERPSL